MIFDITFEDDTTIKSYYIDPELPIFMGKGEDYIINNGQIITYSKNKYSYLQGLMTSIDGKRIKETKRIDLFNH